MKQILTLKGKKLEVKPEVLAIPEFKFIYDEFNDVYLDVFLYIYHLKDYSSPYASMEFTERIARVKEDFFPKKYVKDNKLKKAIEDALNKYDVLSTTPSSKLLEAAKVAVKKISDYLTDTVVDDDNIKSYIGGFDKIATLQKQIAALEEAVNKEHLNTTIRGGGQVNKREKRPSDR